MVKNGVEFVIWVCYSVLRTIYKCSLPAYKNTLETHKTQGGILENKIYFACFANYFTIFYYILILSKITIYFNIQL